MKEDQIGRECSGYREKEIERNRLSCLWMKDKKNDKKEKNVEIIESRKQKRIE